MIILNNGKINLNIDRLEELKFAKANNSAYVVTSQIKTMLCYSKSQIDYRL